MHRAGVDFTPPKTIEKLAGFISRSDFLQCALDLLSTAPIG